MAACCNLGLYPCHLQDANKAADKGSCRGGGKWLCIKALPDCVYLALLRSSSAEVCNCG